jgi:hypothetical protein
MNTPEPRLPLEPEEYPMYRPPRRLGCSGLSVVTVVMLFIFAFLFWRVTPSIVQGFKSLSSNTLNSNNDQGTPLATTGARNLATQTVDVASAPPTATTPPIATPTAARECVQVVRSKLQLRAQPNRNLEGIVVLSIGTKLQLVEPGAAPIKDSDGNTWKRVQELPPDSHTGYVLDDYLKSIPCP